ncbi:hypothetical protein THRCLA_08218 [Thraustotheca clavata]|uniref:Uncharacterized protein n=1 Tax=Thraustotheca clavata TaxID=74557 RepID=A0A1V9Z8B6_9STRA|nr:hypothetical protein THRCLA_08218 [Thraustotheca clavata]
MGMARANDSTVKKSSKKKAAPAPIDFTAIDHPYVVLLNKKLRSLKKKQEKIKVLEESLVGSTKTLNEQQLEVLANKPFVEKMTVELEGLRQLFVETTLLKETQEKQDDNTLKVEEPIVEKEVPEEPKSEEEQENVKAETEAVDPELVAPVVQVSEDEKLQYVAEILKLLHAVSMHQALGHDVPIALDYFVKVLMGGTRPPAEVSFVENLDESIEEAKRYLDNSDKVLACDMSYRDLREAIEKLVNPPVKETAPVEEVPHINFFAEPDEPEENAANDVENETLEVILDAAIDEVVVIVEEGEVVQEPNPEDPSQPKTFASATANKRPHSGHRRHKTSPRNAHSTENGDKPKQPRRQYKPKVVSDATDSKPRPQRAPKASSSSPSAEGSKLKPRRPRTRGPKKESETP